MPTTTLGLLLFVVLLVPGFAYTIVRERAVPERRSSAFRETASVAFASVILGAVALTFFALVRLLIPEITPDVGELIADPYAYTAEHYALVGLWAAGLLALASVLAVRAAQSEWQGWLAWLAGPDARTAHMSAWSRMFSQSNEPIYVGCTLDDGSYVGGFLLFSSRSSDESDERDIALSGRVDYRPDPGSAMTRLPSVGGVVISASRIRLMSLSYYDRDVAEALLRGEPEE